MRYIAIAVCLLLLAAAQAEATTLRLRSGACVEGEITWFDDGGLILVRSDTAGTLDISWDHLDPAERSRICALLGWIPDPDGETIEGICVVLDSGELFEGVIEREAPDRLTLRLDPSRTREIPLKSIRSRQPTTLRALDLLSPEAWLERRLAERPPKNATDRLALARFCRDLGLLKSAADYYDQAAKARPAWADRLQEEIRTLTESPPVPEHPGEAAAPDDSAESAATETVPIERLAAEYARTLKSLIGKATRDPALTYREVRDYVERILERELLDRLAKQFKVDRAALEAQWRARPELDTHPAGYGDGTWILTGTDPTALAAPTDPAGLEEFRKRRDEENELKDLREKAQKNPAFKPMTEEDWWMGATVSRRTAWMEALFAEQFLIAGNVKYANCPGCLGKGVLQASTGYIFCKRCQGLGKDKSFTYR